MFLMQLTFWLIRIEKTRKRSYCDGQLWQVIDQ